MSFAQFNGVSSTENLVVNSITFPDGTSANSFTPLTYTSVVTSQSNIANSVPATASTFYNVAVGTYILSIPLSMTAETSNFTTINVVASNDTQAFTLDYLSSNLTAGSGITQYIKYYSAVLKITTAGNLTVTVTNSLFNIPSNYSIAPADGGLLAELISLNL